MESLCPCLKSLKPFWARIFGTRGSGARGPSSNSSDDPGDDDDERANNQIEMDEYNGTTVNQGLLYL